MKKVIWISIIILIVIIGIFSLNKINQSISHQKEIEEKEKYDDKGEMTKSFTPQMLNRAEDALSKGIIIEDPENDWHRPAEGTIQWDKPDNPNPYPYPFTDLKSVSLGADEEYLYVKFVYYGDFPKTMPSYNGDDIFSTGAKISEMTFITQGGKVDYLETGSGVSYVQFTEEGKTEEYLPLEEANIGQIAMVSPQGEDENGELIYKTMNGAGFITGGPGYDYLLSAFPLYELGISYGDETNFSLATETGSNKWHHESIDPILNQNNSKSSSTIKWKLGDDKYEVFYEIILPKF